MAGDALIAWRRRCLLLAALFAIAGAAAASGTAAGAIDPPATMHVGAARAIKSIVEAARRARDGEVIEIDAGEYRGQVAVWTQNDLVIRSAGGRVRLVAAGASAEGKAIWVVRGGRVRIEDIEFRGARVADGNGAGIRFERGQLVVERCAFFDNEMGILTAASEQMTLTISDSEFGAAPRHPGLLHHLLYVGAIARFELTGSRFSGGYRGHLVKSRARENDVRYNLLVDGEAGGASYELEFPDGGIAYVVGNVIGQSRGSGNPALVAYGAEAARWPQNGLYLVHNTLLSDLPSATLVKTWQQNFAAGFEHWQVNNLVVGDGRLATTAVARSAGNRSLPRGELLADHGLPLRLPDSSRWRGSLGEPGSVHGVDLSPGEEFVFPLGRRQRRAAGVTAPGAFP